MPSRSRYSGSTCSGIARVTLVEVDRDDLEVERRGLAQLQQDVEQTVAVLAAREAHHHAVAGADHVEVGDRLAGEAAQALLELVGLVDGLADLLAVVGAFIGLRGSRFVRRRPR